MKKLRELYEVNGGIEGACVLFTKYTRAYSEPQAKKQIAIRLGKEYPHLKIFLTNVDIKKIPSTI